MLTLVFGIYVSEAMVNRSLDLGILNMFNKVFYKFHVQVKYFTSCNVLAVVLNRFNEVLYKLHLQVTVL